MLELPVSGDANRPLLSLVLCTVGRIGELRDFLWSVADGHPEVELIVVDQNEDESLVRGLVLEVNPRFKRILILRAPRISLSYARNLGLKQAQGRFLGFPDDDCTYMAGFLTEILSKLQETSGMAGCKGVCVTYPGMRRVHNDRIDWKGLMGGVISFSFFIKNRGVGASLCRFNENLGVGCYLGAGEETDFLLRELGGGYLLYDKGLSVMHPEKTLTSAERELTYGRGFGALAAIYLSLRRFAGLFLFCKIMFAPILKFPLLWVRGDFASTKYIVATMVGRWQGFIKYRSDMRFDSGEGYGKP